MSEPKFKRQTEKINGLCKEDYIPRAIEINKMLSHYGNCIIHEPTGIVGYSIEDVKDKLKKHYQKILDRELKFYSIK